MENCGDDMDAEARSVAIPGVSRTTRNASMDDDGALVELILFFVRLLILCTCGHDRTEERALSTAFGVIF